MYVRLDLIGDALRDAEASAADRLTGRDILLGEWRRRIAEAREEWLAQGRPPLRLDAEGMGRAKG